MTTININNPYAHNIKQRLTNCLFETALPKGKKYQGKVRDTYDLGEQLILITTDRQSAFDRFIANVPCKGQVLNQTSAWWFEQSSHIIANHVIAVPDPNVMVAKKCKVFPIEFVVRAYITGSTSTSLWTQYQQGVRDYCGHHFKDGLKKNERLSHPVLTPTTKEIEHDRPIGPNEIIAEGWMSADDFERCSEAALQLFALGTQVAAAQGLILVDTKYEFGRDEFGNIVLIDEIHTPDSSRYWRAESYQERFSDGLEPDNLDKESLRLWFAKHCDPYRDKVLPKAPDDLLIHLASRYIELYERITNQHFIFPEMTLSVHERILQNLSNWLR